MYTYICALVKGGGSCLWRSHKAHRFFFNIYLYRGFPGSFWMQEAQIRFSISRLPAIVVSIKIYLYI